MIIKITTDCVAVTSIRAVDDGCQHHHLLNRE